MNEEWLFPGAVVPVDVETTAALVVEIKRLIDVVGGMALVQPAQRTWVGLTDAQNTVIWANSQSVDEAIRATEKQLMENNI